MHGGVGLNPHKFEKCLGEIRSYLQHRREVESATLYGSAARGQARSTSDLDILIVASRGKHEDIAHDLFRLGARFDVTISPYLVDRNELETIDPQFLESVARDGVTVKGSPVDPILSQIRLAPFRIVTFQLDGLTQADKVALSRQLYGYKSSRTYKGKTYRSHSKGAVEKVGGWKLGRGSCIVPEKAWSQIERALNKRKVKRWSFTVWVQSAYS